MTGLPDFRLTTAPINEDAGKVLRDLITKAIDEWSPTDINGVYQIDGSTLVSVLGSIICQFLASIPDRRVRRLAIRDVQREIERMVPKFIAAGVTMSTTLSHVPRR